MKIFFNIATDNCFTLCFRARCGRDIGRIATITDALRAAVRPTPTLNKIPNNPTKGSLLKLGLYSIVY